MPTYTYEVLNGVSPPEIFEYDQPVNQPPLERHPITNEAVRRTVTASSLSLRHSAIKEKNILSEKNLKKHGFSKFVRSGENSFERTVGKNLK